LFLSRNGGGGTDRTGETILRGARATGNERDTTEVSEKNWAGGKRDRGGVPSWYPVYQRSVSKGDPIHLFKRGEKRRGEPATFGGGK